MAISKAPRKKKPANISKAERRLRKLHLEVKSFIQEYQEKQKDFGQWDVVLRVFFHKLRAMLLRQSHPELVGKYLPGWTPSVSLTEAEWHQMDLHFFGIILGKNHVVRKLKDFDRNEMETLRALYQITRQTKDKERRNDLRKRIEEVELDTTQAMLNSASLVETLVNFSSLRDDMLDYMKENVPSMHLLWEETEPLYQSYLNTLPQGIDNLKQFAIDEKELEDIFVERWDNCRDEYKAELDALYRAEEAAGETVNTTPVAENDDIEDAEIVADVDTEVTAMSEEKEEVYHEQSNL